MNLRIKLIIMRLLISLCHEFKRHATFISFWIIIMQFMGDSFLSHNLAEMERCEFTMESSGLRRNQKDKNPIDRHLAP